MIGENDGWFEVVSINDNIEVVEIILNKRFEKLGHVFQVQNTSQTNLLLICSYTGIHFLKVYNDPKTLTMSLHLSDLSYETEQFVNKVIEYDHGYFLATAWDNNKYIFIDHEQERIETVVVHPHR